MCRAAAVLIAALLLITACATTPPRALSLQPWPDRRAELQHLGRYGLSGRVAVAAGSEGFSGRLNWQQRGPRTELVLNGPLGVGGVRVVAEGDSLDVTNSQGAVLGSDAAHAELRARLGFEPPLTSLRYWILGVPDPDTPSQETLGADQRLAGLTQDGWDVEYSDYVNSAGAWLPRRLSLRRADVRVRLIVDAWQS